MTAATALAASRNIFTQKQEIKGWHISDQLSLTTSDSTGFSGTYWRPSIDVSKRLSFLKNYTVGANYSLEDNQQKDKLQDTRLGHQLFLSDL